MTNVKSVEEYQREIDEARGKLSECCNGMNAVIMTNALVQLLAYNIAYMSYDADDVDATVSKFIETTGMSLDAMIPDIVGQLKAGAAMDGETIQ